MKISDIPAVITYAICAGIGGKIFYQYFVAGDVFWLLYLLPLFVIVSLFAFFIPVGFAPLGIKKPFRGIANWAIFIFITWLLIYGHDYAMNRSKVVLFADYYWNSGIDLYLRKNGTYKAVKTGWTTDGPKYGKYRIDGNRIILEGDLYIGIARMNDTLIYDSKGLHFKLDSEWKGIHGDVMAIQINELFD